MLSLKLRPAPTKFVEDHQSTRARDMLLPLIERFSASVSTSNRHAGGTLSQSLTYSIVRFVCWPQYNAPTGTFTIPPRTTAVFLER